MLTNREWLLPKKQVIKNLLNGIPKEDAIYDLDEFGQDIIVLHKFIMKYYPDMDNMINENADEFKYQREVARLFFNSPPILKVHDERLTIRVGLNINNQLKHIYGDDFRDAIRASNIFEREYHTYLFNKQKIDREELRRRRSRR